MLSLRTAQGINKKTYNQRFKDFQNICKKAETYLETGHLHLNQKGLQASEKGFLILDKITQDLL